MNQEVELPREAVASMKARIWGVLRQPDAAQARAEYARILSVISHPAAVFRLRLVKGGRELQSILNTMIWWRRTCLPLCAVLVVVAILWSWWVALMCPAVFLVNLLVVNPVQTKVNVELAARLFVLDELDEHAPAFRTKVQEAVQHLASDSED